MSDTRRKRKVNLDHLGCVCENAARRKQIATRQWKIKRVLAQLCTQQGRANLGARLLFNLVHKARRKKSQVTIAQFQDPTLGFRVKFESPTHNMVLMTYTRRHPESTASDRDRDNQWNVNQKQAAEIKKAAKERERNDKTNSRTAGNTVGQQPSRPGAGQKQTGHLTSPSKMAGLRSRSCLLRRKQMWRPHQLRV